MSRRSHESLSLNSTHSLEFSIFQTEYFMLTRFLQLESQRSVFTSFLLSFTFLPPPKRMDEHKFSPCLSTSTSVHTTPRPHKEKTSCMIPELPLQCSNSYSVPQVSLRTCQSTQLVTEPKRLHVSPRQFFFSFPGLRQKYCFLSFSVELSYESLKVFASDRDNSLGWDNVE